MAEESMKVKIRGRNVWHFIAGEGRKSVISLEGSQASPARPADKGTVKVKTLGWSEVAALNHCNVFTFDWLLNVKLLLALARTLILGSESHTT
jgi:hypothetical protein